MRLNLYWEQLPYSRGSNAGIEERLSRILLGWDRTPYKNGAGTKGVGVSCYQFIFCVLKELQGARSEIVARLPSAIGRSPGTTVGRATKALMTAFTPFSKVPSKRVQPGDIILLGDPEIGAAHVMLVGPEPRTLWHAAGPRGVCKTGFSSHGNDQVVKIYRLDGRQDRWAS